MSGFPDPVPKPKIRKLQAKFIEAYREKMIAKNACVAAGIARKEYESWRRNYPKFRAECEEVEADIVDLLKERMLVKLGVLKVANSDLNPSYLKWVDNTLLVRAMSMYEEAKVQSDAAPLEIKGLDPTVLKQFLTPEAGREENAEEKEPIEMQGVDRPRFDKKAEAVSGARGGPDGQ